jgi:hypothetical protein
MNIKPGQRISIEQFHALTGGQMRRSKYNAIRTQNPDGTWSDSKREAQYDSKIMMLKHDPSTKRVNRKTSFPLIVNGVLICTYESDWTRELQNGVVEVYDAKGCRTKEYIKKKKLMKEIYGIEIIEL